MSIVYWNIRKLQPEDGFKRKAETCSCHYISNTIYRYIILCNKSCVKLSNYIIFLNIEKYNVDASLENCKDRRCCLVVTTVGQAYQQIAGDCGLLRCDAVAIASIFRVVEEENATGRTFCMSQTLPDWSNSCVPEGPVQDELCSFQNWVRTAKYICKRAVRKISSHFEYF